MQISLELDRSGAASLQVQIYEQVRTLILKRELDPGYALPASRALAGDLNVSRNTVLYAYERLINEGYLETRRTAGTFVTANLPESLLTGDAETSSPASRPIRNGALAPLQFRGRAQALFKDEGARPQIDMHPGRPWRHLFPTKIWRRLMLSRLTTDASQITDYPDPAGLPELREAIAKYLGPARGITATAGQILVTGGTQESLSIIARLFVAGDTPVAIENPCYCNAAYTFESFGARLAPVNVAADGIDLDALAQLDFDLIYVTPGHHYPLGSTMSVEHRLRLLELAQAKRAYIVEDDYDSDFRFDGPPLRALSGIDQNGCVIYLGSLSQSLGAGLRLGYMVLPVELVDAAVTVKSLLNSGNSWLDQAALADMIDSGAYVRHLRRARALYLGRRNNLVNALKTAFDNVHLSGADGGTHLLWQLPAQFPTAAALQAMALRRGVGIYTTSSGNACDFGGSPYADNGVVLGYSSVSEKQIWEAISRIAQSLEKAGYQAN